MILDANLEFCDAVSVAAAAGTTLIGNQIDTSVARPLGTGKPLYLNITVDTAIVTGGSAGTLQFALASDSTAAIDTATSTVHLVTPAFVTDDSPTIPAGTVLFSGAIPSGANWVDSAATQGDGAKYERYLGILATVGTTTITAGKVNVWLSLDPIGYTAMPDAQN